MNDWFQDPDGLPPSVPAPRSDFAGLAARESLQVEMQAAQAPKPPKPAPDMSRYVTSLRPTVPMPAPAPVLTVALEPKVRPIISVTEREALELAVRVLARVATEAEYAPWEALSHKVDSVIRACDAVVASVGRPRGPSAGAARTRERAAELRASGLSFQQVADKLTEEGFEKSGTGKGSPWTRQAVANLLKEGDK